MYVYIYIYLYIIYIYSKCHIFNLYTFTFCLAFIYIPIHTRNYINSVCMYCVVKIKKTHVCLSNFRILLILSHVG